MKLKEFTLDERTGVYVQDRASEISYVDTSERYLLRLFEKVRDLSSSSQELARYIRDWPTEYHLSPLRANILRALDFLTAGGSGRFRKVLELGSGCGAITRWLGENFEEVHAVEGSFDRALLTRKRCRDLDGVKVFCANIQDLSPEPEYDIVTLVGVLEYAPVFFSGLTSKEDACLSMLRKAASFLKPGGLLILAIENRFGLKYWSGCPEDHTNRIFDGIHGYPMEGTPVTFSRDELARLISSSGFGHIEFYFPFPDYKLCEVVIREDEKISECFVHNWIKTPFTSSYPRIYTVHEGLSLRSIVRSGLLPQFSNSFLVVASNCKRRSYKKPNWLIKKIVNRPQLSEDFHHVITLERSRGGGLKVKRGPLRGGKRSFVRGPLAFNLERESSFVPGDLLVFEAYKAIYSGEFESRLLRLLDELKGFILKEFGTGEKSDGYPLLKGESIDCTLWNVVRKDGSLFFIDRKWSWNKPVTLDFVMFRNLLHFIPSNIHYFRSSDRKDPEELMLGLLKKMFPNYDEKRMTRNSMMETELQWMVEGNEPPELKVSIVIPVFNKVEYTAKCLDALYSSTMPGMFEVIIVDNGSTDGTQEFLNRFSRGHKNVKVVRNSKNLGFARACNQGAKEAKGKYIVFLNNDTVPIRGWLEELVRVAEVEDRVGAVGAKLLFPDGTIQHAGVMVADHPLPVSPFHVFYRFPPDHPEANVFREMQAVTAACMLVPKDVFDELGGFDEGFLNGYEDVDLCFRLRELGYRVIYTPRSVLYHHESVSEGRFKWQRENERRLLEKWAGRIEPDVIVDAPKVSIVILNYNGSEDTIECLKSIYEDLMYKSFQVIVVDNGSDPSDVSKLRKWINSYGIKKKGNFEKELVFIESDGNLGFSGGCNLGIKYALSHGAEYVWLLNNDTVVDSRALDALVGLAEKDPGIGLVASKLISYSDPSRVQYDGNTISYRGIHDPEEDDTPKPTKVISCCSLLVRTELFRKIGLLDEDYFLYFEDNDILERSMKGGWKAYYCPASVVYHKGGSSIGAWFETPMSVYYGTRNFLLHVSKFRPDKMGMHSKTLLEMYIRAKEDTLSLYAFCRGIEDFIRGFKGRADIPFDRLKDTVEEFKSRWEDGISSSPKGFREAFYSAMADLLFNPDDENKLEKFLSVSQSLFLKKSSGALDFEVEVAERLYKEGKIQDAKSRLEDVIWLDSSFFKAHSGLAVIYWQEGNLEKSLENIVRAMELAPDDRDVVWNAGQILVGLGYTGKALELLKGYLKRHPEERDIKEMVDMIEKRREDSGL